MIPFEEALDIVAKAACPPELERVGLVDLMGRILAEDIVSDRDMPPFHKSAVDGYACRSVDLEQELRVMEIIPAGRVPQHILKQGECSKIMTGGMVPAGADRVLMVEDVITVGEDTIRFTGTNPATNICYQAEDLRKGDCVIKKGSLIRAQEVAVLASVGVTYPLVYTRVKIGIITTGDELVEPDKIPGPAQIRNSNAWQLIVQARNAGCIPQYYGIAGDEDDKIFDLIEKASEENSIIILTGGISVGDFDFVPEVLQKAGFKIHFQKLNVQPGKPVIFASREKCFAFALPGNPVSSFMQFELLVRHFINSMTGCFASEKVRLLPMGFDYQRKNSGRKAFVPVVFLPDGTLGTVDYHGSAHIHSYIFAEGIISAEIGTNEIKKGTFVNVRFL